MLDFLIFKSRFATKIITGGLMLLSITLISCQKESNLSEMIHTSELPRLEPKPEFIIADSDEVLFMQIEELTTDQKGNIFVPDQSLMQIHIFNPHGDFVTSIGGRGAGPGEFQAIYNVFTDLNGRLFVNDPPQGRSTIFTEMNGEWDIWQMIVSEDGSRYAVESAGPNGELIFRQSPSQPVEPGLFWYEHEFATGSIEEGIVDENILSFKVENILVRDNQLMQWMPIQWTTIVSRAPDGSIFMVWNDRFEVAVHDPSLSFLDSLKAAIPNQPIEQDERRELLEEGFIPDLRSLGRQLLPETKPVIKQMFVDSEKNMWLQTYDTPEYLILDDEGHPIGSFDLPEELTLSHVDSGRLYTIYSGDMGYEIHVFTIDIPF